MWPGKWSQVLSGESPIAYLSVYKQINSCISISAQPRTCFTSRFHLDAQKNPLHDKTCGCPMMYMYNTWSSKSKKTLWCEVSLMRTLTLGEMSDYTETQHWIKCIL